MESSVSTHVNSSLNRLNIQAAVEMTLQQIIDQEVAAARDIEPSYLRLWEEIRRSLFAGGKRTRPFLAVITYFGLGGNNPAIYQIGAAQELLHAALLIHDDIMDRDYTRHGGPNLAGHYLQHYASAGDVTHLSDSAALLAGDLLLSLSHQVIYRADFPEADRQRAATYLGRAVFEVAAGQLMDMEATTKQPSLSRSLQIAELKTASYSFVGPMAIGAVLAGASSEVIGHCTRFGKALGIGFQLADDLLGLFGSEAKTGKSVLSDLREGKATYLIALARRHASPADKTWLSEHWGATDATNEDVEQARLVIERSGAKARVQQELAVYAEEASRHLAHIPLRSEAATALAELIPAAMWRQA